MPQNQQRPQPGVMYDNPEYMNNVARMPGSPYENQDYVIQDPRTGYYSTATLPSNAALRKPSVASQGGYVVQYARATSEPRAKPGKMMSTSTLDRYTLMSNSAQRSKSAERVPIKYRRVSLDPTAYQTNPPNVAYVDGRGQKVRSVSMATHEAGDIHVLNNPQMYRYVYPCLSWPKSLLDEQFVAKIPWNQMLKES